jgi:kynurenine formamidase
MHKLILALLAFLLVGVVVLFVARWTSHAPDKLANENNSPYLQGLLDETKVIDLTYNFDDRTIYWPTAKNFRWEKESWGKSKGGFWYTAARYSGSEHGGTHLDSPIHFGEGKMTTEEIPLSNLIAPAIVIDISKACADNPDYRLTTTDISDWEKANGQIPSRTIVLVHTGWGKFWLNKKRYLGTDRPGDTANLRFPGISAEAAVLLAGDRKIDGVGIDTASIDYGRSKIFIAHQVFNGANIYALENVANLEKLPAKGAFLIALPMKIRGGTGGPVRIIAILP